MTLQQKLKDAESIIIEMDSYLSAREKLRATLKNKTDIYALFVKLSRHTEQEMKIKALIRKWYQ